MPSLIPERGPGRLLVSMAVVMMGALLLAAGGTGPASAARTTITFSFLWTGQGATTLDNIANQFNHSQNSVFVKTVSNPDEQKQLAEMATSNGGFDVSDNFGWDTAALASKGLIASLSPFISSSHYSTSDFVKPALTQDKYQGKIYALPIALQDYMLIYNKKDFQDAGITSPPTTTSEWAADIAKTTKVDANGNITQLGYFFPSIGITTGQNQAELANSFGGSWYSASGKPTPYNAGTVAACNFYVDNIPAKYGANKVNQFVSGFGDTGTAQDPLLTGKLAMRVDGEWMSPTIQQYAPAGFQWGVVPIPYPDGRSNLKDSTQVDVSMIFIPNNSQHKGQAWQFLKYLVNKSNMRTFTLNGNNPARYSLLKDSAYNQMTNFSVWENELYSPNAKTLPTEPYSAQYTADIGTALSNSNLLQGSCKSNLQQLATRTKTYSTTG